MCVHKNAEFIKRKPKELLFLQVILFNMKIFRTGYGQKTVCLLFLLGMQLLSVQGFAQSGKSSTQLKKDKQKIENEIAQTQKLLKKTESNQKAAVQQAALLRQQIQNREKIITNLNSQIIQMEDEQEQNQQIPLRKNNF